MDHVRDMDFIEYAAGRLAPDQRERIEQHTQHCERCRKKLQQTQQTWEMLGEWKLTAPEHDLSGHAVAEARLRDAADAEAAGSRKRAASFAAVIVIASLVGGLAGRFLFDHPTAQPPDQQQLAQALHLKIFQTSSPVGLADLVLEEDCSQ